MSVRARVVAAALCLWPRISDASSSVWERARDPGRLREDRINTGVEQLLVKHRLARRDLLASEAVLLAFRKARRLLEATDAAGSRNPITQFRLAQVRDELGDSSGAMSLFDAVAHNENAAPTHRAEAAAELAMCHAKLGHHAAEIDAYALALALEPQAMTRSNILSNQAEAWMALGNLDAAVAGYRAALASTTTFGMFRSGVTALWGLAVALDRSGDVGGALSSIDLARAYDPADVQLHSPSWFFQPPHEEAYYAALGHWARARNAAGAECDAFYRAAIQAWREYIERAPASDPWRDIAKARWTKCEAEHVARMRAEGPKKRGADVR